LDRKRLIGTILIQPVTLTTFLRSASRNSFAVQKFLWLSNLNNPKCAQHLATGLLNGRHGRHHGGKKKDESLPLFMMEEATMMKEVPQLVSRLLSQSVFAQRLQVNTWNYRKIKSLETVRDSVNWCQTHGDAWEHVRSENFTREYQKRITGTL